MASISSALSKGLSAVESVLSVTDVLTGGISIATGYVNEVRTKQEKSSANRMSRFEDNLKLEKVSDKAEFATEMYKLGDKLYQLNNLPNFERNVAIFESYLKDNPVVTTDSE